MPIPAAWNTVTVTGTYVDAVTGNPSTGYVLFDGAPPVVVSGTTVLPRQYIGYLNASGNLKDKDGVSAFVLPATDDPDITPNGWAWRVTEFMDGGRAPYYINVPYAGGPIDLHTVAPVNFGLQPAPYIALVNATDGNPLSGDYVFGSSSGNARRFPAGGTNGVVLAPDLAASSGSLSVGFIQTGTGAVARTVGSRMKDWVNIKDFGANASAASGTTTNRVAIQAALDSFAGATYPGTVIVPRGEFITDLPINHFYPNVTIALEGSIHNTNVTAGSPNALCFNIGSYNHQSQEAQTYYTATAGAVSGAFSVTLDAGANRTNGAAVMPVGTLVFIRSKTYMLNGNSDQVCTYAQLAMVTAVNSSTGVVSFEPPIDEDVASVLIAPANVPSYTTYNSRGLYAAYRNNIIGPGRLQSDNFYPVLTGGMHQGVIDIGSMVGYGGVFGNLVSHSKWKVGTVNCTQKIQDLAMNSNNSQIDVVSAYCNSTGGIATGMVLWANEHTRKCHTRYGSINTPLFTGGSDLILCSTGAHNNSFHADSVIAPLATASMVQISNTAETVLGDQVQHTTVDNTLSFGQVNGGASTRYVLFDNSGGQNARNKVLRGRFVGAISGANAFQLDGTDHVIGAEVRCEQGNLLVNASQTRLTCHGAYFLNDVAYSGGAKLSGHSIRNIRSASQQLLKAASTTGGPLTVNSTSANNQVDIISAAASALLTGDLIEITGSGTITGTNNTKMLQLVGLSAADNPTLLAVTFAAGTTGAFSFEARYRVNSNASYAGSATITTGTTATPTRTSRGGLDLATNGLSVALQAWVTNAADGVVLDRWSMKITRASGDTP